MTVNKNLIRALVTVAVLTVILTALAGCSAETDTSGSNGYISTQEAADKAAAHVGTTTDMLTGLKIEMDQQNSLAIYEVEFTLDGFDYTLRVDAQTGNILSADKEACEGNTVPSGDDKPQYNSLIGEAAAMDAALQHANMEPEKVVDSESRLDEENCRYNIIFVAEGYEYHYEIDGRSGTVLKAEKEQDNDGVANPETTVPSLQQTLTEEDAMNAALGHADLSQEEITGLAVELNDADIGEGADYGVAYYEVSFSFNNLSYDYDIDARTGLILNIQIEGDIEPDVTEDAGESDDYYDDEADDFEDIYDDYEDNFDDIYDDYEDGIEDDFEDGYGDDIPFDE